MKTRTLYIRMYFKVNAFVPSHYVLATTQGEILNDSDILEWFPFEDGTQILEEIAACANEFHNTTNVIRQASPLIV